ncbi:MAG: acyltransferase [Kiritimatiellae bacterium]|nr:acyltransferase [Kiritimatiellia bacterium]
MSAVIDVLRFPLISLVVLYHAFNCSVTLPPGAFDWHQPATDFVYWKLLHDSIASSAVPLFFAMSGFLYFRRDGFGWAMWLEKTKSRLLRLWIPLLAWAGLSLLFWGVLYVSGSPNATAQDLFGSRHGFGWWMDAFFGICSVPGPHLFHAGWFVRDLFFAGLFSLLWYALLRNKHLVFPVLSLLYILYLTVFAPLPFLGPRAMFFFSLGAAYAIHRRDFTADAERVAIPCAILWGIGVTIQLFKELPFVDTLTTTLLIPVLVALASWGIRRGWWRPVPWLAASSFFVYFCHEFMGFRVAVDAVRTRLFIPYGDWACLGFILVNWIAGTGLSLAVFLLLRRFVPYSLVVLAGMFPSKHH